MDSPSGSPSPCYLGVDGGGTKTAWALLVGSEVLAEGAATGLQLATMDFTHVADQLVQIIALAQRAAPAPIAGVVAGLAGAGSVAARAALRAALVARGSPTSIIVVGDPEVAAAAALEAGPGVALWSGTGSFAIARGPAGDIVRVGGRGWLLGDQGSAFDLARRGAAAALAAVDGLGPPTALTASFQSACGLADPADLGRHLQAVPPAALAAHYGLVVQAMGAGDAVAAAIVFEGARALGGLVQAAAARAAMPLTDLRVVLGGGLLQRDATLREALAGELRRRGVELAAELCAASAAVGAARLARAFAERQQPLSTWVNPDAAG